MLQASHLHIGLTAVNPRDWDRKSRPWDSSDTWCLWTWNGERWSNGVRSQLCTQWGQRFSDAHKLAAGDTVSVTLLRDRSVSITQNDTEVPAVFTDLPHTALWVVIKIGLKSLVATKHCKYVINLFKCTDSDRL